MSADLLTPAEAAALLRVTPETVRRWVRAGRLRAAYLGPRLRLERQDVLGLVRGATLDDAARSIEERVAWALARGRARRRGAG